MHLRKSAVLYTGRARAKEVRVAADLYWRFEMHVKSTRGVGCAFFLVALLLPACGGSGGDGGGG